MADREDQSNLPPIPDGGLAQSMPDWLRRPPAWRTLPDREVSVPEPEETAALPEPDDSVIDPRTFLGDDDLPAWLRNLGQGRRVPPAAEGEPVDVATAEAQDVVADPGRSASNGPSSQIPARFVPTSPPVPTSKLGPMGRSLTTGRARSRPTSPSTPAWQGAWLVAGLAALLVVAIVVIAVLVL